MKELHGIIPPVVTPLTPGGELDVAGLEQLLEYVLAGGVHGLFILGSTGEGPAIGFDRQCRMISETCRIVRKRVPVLVGISSAALDRSIELAGKADTAGADGIVSAPPCYFNCGMPEVIDYFDSLAARTKLPLLIYNMPSMTKTNITPATVITLARNPRIIGYKDSSGNMCDLHEVIQVLGGNDRFSIFVGPEELLGEAVLFGADGGVSGGANLSPHLFVNMYEAALSGDIPEMRRCQRLIYCQRKLYSLGRFQSSMIKGVKTALSLRGICSDTMVMPFQRFDTMERRRVEEILQRLDCCGTLSKFPS